MSSRFAYVTAAYHPVFNILALPRRNPHPRLVLATPRHASAMLLDDRRIVLSLEAICWCTAAMVFLQQTDFPSAIAILPLLMAVLIHVEYAPPAPHSASRMRS